MAATFGALSEDTEALQGRRSPPGRRRSPRAPRRCARSARSWSSFADLSARLRPGVNALEPRAADPQRRARGRRPGARADAADQRASWAASSASSKRWSTSRRRRRRCCACARPSTRRRRRRRHIAPYQTVCNYWNYWFTYLPEHLTERDNIGTTQRVSVIGARAARPSRSRRGARPARRLQRPAGERHGGATVASIDPTLSRASSRRTSCRSCTAMPTARRSTPTAPPTASPARPATCCGADSTGCRARRSTTRPSGSPTSPAAAGRPSTAGPGCPAPTAAEGAAVTRGRARSASGCRTSRSA